MFLNLCGFAQTSTQYFRVLPPDPVSATYAVFHAAILTDSVGPNMFFYYTDPNHQLTTNRYRYDNGADSLITSDTVFGLQCHQKYYAVILGFMPGQFGNVATAIDSFYTLDTIGCTTTIKDMPANKSNLVYPIPVVEQSQLIIPELINCVAEVYDAMGRHVTSIIVNNGTGIIGRNDFKIGVYFYRVLTRQKIYTGRFIVQ